MFLVSDLVVLFLFRLGRKPLPGKFACKEVDQDVSKSFKIISSGLLIPQMRVERGISCGSGEIFTLFPRDVDSCFRVSESLGEAKIDEIDVRRLLVADEEIIRLDVSMQIVTGLNMLNPFKL